MIMLRLNGLILMDTFFKQARIMIIPDVSSELELWIPSATWEVISRLWQPERTIRWFVLRTNRQNTRQSVRSRVTIHPMVLWEWSVAPEFSWFAEMIAAIWPDDSENTRIECKKEVLCFCQMTNLDIPLPDSNYLNLMDKKSKLKRETKHLPMFHSFYFGKVLAMSVRCTLTLSPRPSQNIGRTCRGLAKSKGFCCDGHGESQWIMVNCIHSPLVWLVGQSYTQSNATSCWLRLAVQQHIFILYHTFRF